ncbi:MAG: site-specific integrase [Oscillospiraceae bacterium]
MKRTTTAVWMDNHKRWQINVQKDCERRSFYSSTPGRDGKRECHRKADQWLDDNITDQNVRFSTLYKEYVENLKLTTSKSNWSKIDCDGRNWIIPVIGKKKISSLTEQNLQSVIDKAYAAGLAKKTLSNIKAVLTSFMKYCRRKKVSTLLPENLNIPKGAKIGEKRILQPDDLTKLFTVDTTMMRGKRIEDKYINAYRFHVLTGLRPGELMGLEWTDIIGNMVYIKRSINQFREITKGKNNNAIRHFALTDIAQQVILEQKNISKTNSVFEIERQQTYAKYWERYCAANNIPHVSLYEMRHTFVSIAKNLSSGQIRPLIGHSKNMDTFGTYGHEMKGELQNTAQQLNGLFYDILKSVL